jgi:hypothetical protein
MNIKKIIILLCLAFLTISSIGLTNALTLTSATENNPETSIILEGIEFNIPDGYVKNNTKSIVNETRNTGNKSFFLNQIIYENCEGKEIIISVVDYENFDVDANQLYKICEGNTEKSIMGYSGYINQNDTTTKFTYAFNHRAVSITAPAENLIHEILVVEDA